MNKKKCKPFSHSTEIIINYDVPLNHNNSKWRACQWKWTNIADRLSIKQFTRNKSCHQQQLSQTYKYYRFNCMRYQVGMRRMYTANDDDGGMSNRWPHMDEMSTRLNVGRTRVESTTDGS